MAIINDLEGNTSTVFDKHGFVDEYLHIVRNRSTKAAQNHKGVILECLNHINKPIHLIRRRDIKEYFKKIVDKKDIKLVSKETYRSYLKSFFYYVEDELEDDEELDIDFMNPVPTKKSYKFTKRECDIEDAKDEKDEIFSRKQLLELLIKTKQIKFRDFIIFCILIGTGMRVSEALTIKIQKIDLEKRIIKTGKVINARKTGKELVFFIPKKFVPFLDKYIRIVNRKTGWLFPGKKDHLRYNHWHRQIRKKYGTIYGKTHRFRKSIISYRVDIGCPLYVSEMLTNHQPTSVQGKYYIKKSFANKRQLYDKWFPYYSFPWF